MVAIAASHFAMVPILDAELRLPVNVPGKKYKLVIGTVTLTMTAATTWTAAGIDFTDVIDDAAIDENAVYWVGFQAPNAEAAGALLIPEYDYGAKKILFYYGDYLNTHTGGATVGDGAIIPVPDSADLTAANNFNATSVTFRVMIVGKALAADGA